MELCRRGKFVVYKENKTLYTIFKGNKIVFRTLDQAITFVEDKYRATLGLH